MTEEAADLAPITRVDPMATDESAVEVTRRVVYNAWNPPPYLDPPVRICPNCLQHESPERYKAKSKECEQCGCKMFGCASSAP